MDRAPIDFQEEMDMAAEQILNRELFLYLVDLEVRRARRYQNFFCLLKLKLSPFDRLEKGKELHELYQLLGSSLRGELRESDILASLGNGQLAALLPYVDPKGSGLFRSRLEASLEYFGFKNAGYELMIDEIWFPKDGTVTEQLVLKLLE